MRMDDGMMKAIQGIYSRGNTAEVKKVKDGIIVLEVKKKIIYQSGGQNGAR